MSMTLTADQLRELADQLDKLKSITSSSLTIETFTCQGHKIMLQPLNGELTVVGITSGAWSGPAAGSTCRCRIGTVCRCATRDAGQRGVGS